MGCLCPFGASALADGNIKAQKSYFFSVGLK